MLINKISKHIEGKMFCHFVYFSRIKYLQAQNKLVIMAFKLFKKKKKKKALQDIDGNLLQVGDKVDCMRYEMGESILLEGENGYEYKSINSNKIVSYAKMIDAATSFQKVRKLN